MINNCKLHRKINHKVQKFSILYPVYYYIHL